AHTDRDLRGPPAGEDGEGCPEVRRPAAQRLAGLVRALRDRSAHAGAGDVREVRLRGFALPGAKPRPTEIDLADSAVPGRAQGVVESTWNPVRAHEVAAGALRDDCEIDPGAARDSIHDLVDGPVSSDGDEQLGAVVGRPPHELRQVSG